MNVIQTLAAAADPHVERVVRSLTVQQGPGEILVMTKLQFKRGLETEDIIDGINTFEREIRALVREAKWCFIEPGRAR